MLQKQIRAVGQNLSFPSSVESFVFHLFALCWVLCTDLWLERGGGNIELVLLSPVLKLPCLPNYHKKLVMEKDCWHLLRSVALHLSAARMALTWILFV